MRRPDARHLPVVLLCMAAAAARLIVGAHITDDAYITMRYSRNLSSAGAMSYNPPDAVLGTSTPLWTWILAAGNAGGVPSGTTAVAAASLADMCSIVLILVSPVGQTFAAVVSAATIAAWPAYVMYAVSGMETSLYVLTVVAFVTALTRGRTTLGAGAASLGALCRPDGALLVVIGFVWTLLVSSRRAAVRFGITAALLCAPWAVYAIVRFGSAIPASVSAKAAATDPWLLSLHNVGAYFLQGVYAWLTVLALAGFVLIAKNGSSPARRFWRLWSVWAWSYLLAMTAANGFTHFPWYFVPLLPVYTASAAIAVEELAARFRQATAFIRTPAARAAWAWILAAVLLSRMPSLKSYLDASAAGRETLYASVAAELAGVDPGCTVAATEIGAIGFHYPGRILDLVGLVSPEVVGRPLDAVLAGSDAQWLVTYDTHFDRTVAGSESFARLFERRSTRRISEGRALEIYERRVSRCHTP